MLSSIAEQYRNVKPSWQFTGDHSRNRPINRGITRHTVCHQYYGARDEGSSVPPSWQLRPRFSYSSSTSTSTRPASTTRRSMPGRGCARRDTPRSGRSQIYSLDRVSQNLLGEIIGIPSTRCRSASALSPVTNTSACPAIASATIGSSSGSGIEGIVCSPETMTAWERRRLMNPLVTNRCRLTQFFRENPFELLQHQFGSQQFMGLQDNFKQFRT